MADASADHSIGAWTSALAAKQATPGGGGAAAIAGAIGTAAGAMAARYTTGKRWQDRSERVEQLLAQLDAAQKQFLALADEDATAYAALQASWRDQSLDDATRAAVTARALAVPATCLELCATTASALAKFLDHCNPQIVSDARVGIHLCAGAGRAAWQTLHVNKPNAEQSTVASAHLQQLHTAEQACGLS